MTLVHPRVGPTFVAEPDAEALIRAARRLRRRRWFIGVMVVVIAGTASGLGYGFSMRSAKTAQDLSGSKLDSKGGATADVATVTPKTPDALALGPDGDLYVVDSGRDEILRRLSDGKFEVLAGNGKRGFSGDGGNARAAEIDLGEYGTISGIAVGADGTVYFSDSGNDRVRAVLKDGDIETVAGGGKLVLPSRPGEEVPVRAASLGGPEGLAFGPNRELYIAGNRIVRLTQSGQLAWVAGGAGRAVSCSATPCRIPEQFLNGAGALAFDGSGNLLTTGLYGYGWGVAEIRTTGALVGIGDCRGEGGKPAALATEPNGSVICVAQTGLFEIAKGGESETSIRGVVSLSAALGVGPSGPFLGGDGIAIGRNGDIYVDTGPNATATPNAIVELTPSGAAHTLWRSRTP